MIWVGWRQQRLETLIAAALLAVLAAVAIPVGIHMASVYTHEGLAACRGNANAGSCGLPEAQFLIRFNGLNLLFGWATLVPALAALLFAAPFVLDLDNGTYRLYWTQSITRRRWIVTKLGFGVVASVVVAGCVIALAMWSRSPIDHLAGQLNGTTYDAEGIVPIADALFVLGVAVAIGALWRRAVPALLVSFVVYVVGRALMDSWLRQRLLSPVKTTWLAGKGSGPNLNEALVIDQFVSNKSGHRLAGAAGPFRVLRPEHRRPVVAHAALHPGTAGRPARVHDRGLPAGEPILGAPGRRVRDRRRDRRAAHPRGGVVDEPSHRLDRTDDASRMSST